MNRSERTRRRRESGSDAEGLAAVERAIADVITGDRLSKAATSKPPIAYAVAWSPRDGGRAAPAAGPAAAQVVIRTSLHDLQARVHDWMWDDEKAIGGRRPLEMMAIWLDRAAQGWSAHATLLNAEQVIREWAGLLSSFLPEGVRDQGTSTDIEIEQMPFSMRVGHPRFRKEQLREWLAEIRARPGWRLASTPALGVVAVFLWLMRAINVGVLALGSQCC